MSTHRHHYYTIAFWTLTLPDCEGYADHFLSWACDCGDEVWATGYFHRAAHAMDPRQWQSVLARERLQKTLLGQVAMQEERTHIAVIDKYTAFNRHCISQKTRRQGT